MARTALAIEREVDDIRSIWGMGVSTKVKENQSSSAPRRSRRLLLCMDFKDGVAAIRAKAKSGLLARRGR